ncbi:hypothetical protein DYI95_007480 [Thermaerobacter sp. PB12/4term]|uniref:hypothetical protein n=1 Tax=Thermaerobacter sp. PB12/4term TaxID=2293838 RepID=UPI000E325E64|nr:hypothetical protein [Thermaerobacter sp. PB12/4term]QIA27396.1 hypothetical protein DYI95_007480 [Thermaerobacter sp. PB12/4term]
MGVRVSRWTLPYFTAALVCFAVAQAVLALGWAYPEAGLGAPPTLAVVHLLTIGWLSLLILGALQQFVPVITERSLASDTAAAWALGLILTGLGGMVLGFLALPGGPLAGSTASDPGPAGGSLAVPAPAPALRSGLLVAALPAGGTLVLAGFAVAAVNLAIGLWRARPLVLPARFVAVGLAFLLLTGGLGVSLALVLALPDAAGRHLSPALTAQLLARGLPLHMAAGLGGWFTLTAMGVAYKLLSMFTLAPEERGPVGRWVLRLAGTGLAVAWLGGLAFLLLAAAGATGPAGAGTPDPAGASTPATGSPGLTGTDALATGLAGLATAGWVAAGAGVLLYLWDMRRLYRQRRRQALELNARYAPIAFGALAAGVVLMAAGAFLGRLAGLAPALVYLLLFGWLSGLGLTQLYKIVPFLTWLERFGPRLGRGPAIRVQDLVNEDRARPWFWLYFAAVAAATAAALAGWDGLWRAMTGLTLMSTLAIALELWRARRADPKPQAAPVPPPWLGERGRAGGAAGRVPPGGSGGLPPVRPGEGAVQGR